MASIGVIKIPHFYEFCLAFVNVVTMKSLKLYIKKYTI